MRLFTNKFPILQNCICIQPDSTVNEGDIKVVFEEGKIFKVVGIDQIGVLLQCEGKSIIINGDLFSTAFTETDIAT